MGCESSRCETSTPIVIFIVIPSLEGWPTKAKEATSPHEARLAPLDTNPVFQCLSCDEKLMLVVFFIFCIKLQQHKVLKLTWLIFLERSFRCFQTKKSQISPKNDVFRVLWKTYFKNFWFFAWRSFNIWALNWPKQLFQENPLLKLRVTQNKPKMNFFRFSAFCKKLLQHEELKLTQMIFGQKFWTEVLGQKWAFKVL